MKTLAPIADRSRAARTVQRTPREDRSPSAPGGRGLDAVQDMLDRSPRVSAAQRRADGIVQRAPRIQRRTGGPVVQRDGTGLARGTAKTAASGLGAWGGAQLGAALGSWLGPLGALAGGVVGGLAGGLAGYAATGAAIETFRVPRMESALRAITGRSAPTHVGDWQAYTDRQTRDLDALEHEAYAWLDENRLNPGAKLFMPRVLDLLDAVQTEHQAVIDQVHQRNLDLWTPDRDALGATESAKLQQAWNALRNETGLVRTQGPAADGGRDLLRASHARLLSRPTGRRLLYTLLDMEGVHKNKAVNIKFTPPDTRSTSDKRYLRQKRRELDALGQRLEAAEGTEAYDDLYGEHARAKWDVQELSGSSDAAKASADDKHAASLGGTGAGSSSTVDVRQGTRDSDDLTYDWFGRATAAPAWLQYGHELVHVLHNRDAESRTGEDFGRYHGGRWTDREEYVTIKGLARGSISENALRAEHGITGRFGHSGTSRDEWEGR